MVKDNPRIILFFPDLGCPGIFHNFQLCGGYSLLSDCLASLLIVPLLTYTTQDNEYLGHTSLNPTKLSPLASLLVYRQHFPPERLFAGWVTGWRSALRGCLCPLLNAAFPHRPLVTSLQLCRKRVGDALQQRGMATRSVPSFRPGGGGHGGGVAIIHKDGLSAQTVSTIGAGYTTFEHCDVQFTNNSGLLNIIVVYCPPPTKRNGHTVGAFLDEFQSLLEDRMSSLVILGDLNFHVDNAADSNAKKILDLLDLLNFSQHVTSITHKAGHMYT